VSPTLHYYSVGRDEEANKVIRQYRSQSSDFIRLSFVTEDMDKGFYSTVKFSGVLGYIHGFI